MPFFLLIWIPRAISRSADILKDRVSDTKCQIGPWPTYLANLEVIVVGVVEDVYAADTGWQDVEDANCDKFAIDWRDGQVKA